MTVKRAASKVKGAGNKIVDAIEPLAIALPVAMPNINALMSGGPRALMNYNAQAVKSWRPPDMNTINAYVDGPGGAGLITGLSMKLGKWGIRQLGLGGEFNDSLFLLMDAVENWGTGSAVGFAVKEIIYPTAAAGGGTFSGVSFGGWGGQPAKGSSQEMATKDAKPKSKVVFN